MYCKKSEKMKQLKKLKVIVFSNLGEEADIKKCLDLGVSEYLGKSELYIG
jgi:DNA-binding NarL/FixJ family response regulator